MLLLVIALSFFPERIPPHWLSYRTLSYIGTEGCSRADACPHHVFLDDNSGRDASNVYSQRSRYFRLFIADAPAVSGVVEVVLFPRAELGNSPPRFPQVQQSRIPCLRQPWANCTPTTTLLVGPGWLTYGPSGERRPQSGSAVPPRCPLDRG